MSFWWASAGCSCNVPSWPAAGNTTAPCPAPPSRRAFPMKPPVPGISPPGAGPTASSEPACHRHDRGWELKRRRASWECAACGKETSVTAGTIMHRRHDHAPQPLAPEDLVHGRSHRDQPLERYLRPATPGGARARQGYKSAWLRVLHKLRRAMVDPDRSLLGARPDRDR